MTGRHALILAAAVVLGLTVALWVLMQGAPSAPPAQPSFVPPIGRDARGAPPAIMQATPSDVASDAKPVPGDAAPRDEREALLAQLRDSGSGAEPWNEQGLALLEALSHDGVDIRAPACFVAGCGATLTFSSEPEYRRRIDQLQRSDLYRAWTGGHRLTTPELRTDGHVVVGLVLYRPD